PTSAAAGRKARSSDAGFLLKLAWMPIASICAAVFLSVRHPDALPFALPVLLLWTAFPFSLLWLNTPLRQAPHRRLSAADKRWLRRVARQTWRYFDELVNPQSN